MFLTDRFMASDQGCGDDLPMIDLAKDKDAQRSHSFNFFKHLFSIDLEKRRSSEQVVRPSVNRPMQAFI